MLGLTLLETELDTEVLADELTLEDTEVEGELETLEETEVDGLTELLTELETLELTLLDTDVEGLTELETELDIDDDTEVDGETELDTEDDAEFVVKVRVSVPRTRFALLAVVVPSVVRSVAESEPTDTEESWSAPPVGSPPTPNSITILSPATVV